MSDSYGRVLGVSRALLQILRVFNLVIGVALFVALVASFFYEPVLREFFSKQPARIDAGLLVPALRVWVLLAWVGIAAVHIQLTRLLAMVETVRLGDPFVPDNAARLKTIAWCQLVLELLHLAYGGMVAVVNAAGSNLDWNFSLTGWLAVVLMFVLAHVFQEGARIRDDLKAMI